MHFTWQDATALILAAAAVAYLGYRVRGILRRDGKGGCGNCRCHQGRSAATALRTKDFVPLDSLVQNANLPAENVGEGPFS